MKYLAFMLSVLIVSCTARNTESCHKVLTVSNKTDKTLYVFASNSIMESQDPSLNPGFTTVEPQETTNRVLPLLGRCLEDVYPQDIPTGIMKVYVFDRQVFQNNSWQTVRENSMWLQRFDLTLNDWRNSDWTLTYDEN